LEGSAGRILFARLRENDDLAESIKRSAEENGVKAGIFMLIGALKSVKLGCYKKGLYVTRALEGRLEVASCMGNVAVGEKGETIIHGHIVVSNEKGEAFGGHLMKGCRVSSTAELAMVEATGVTLQKSYDKKTKLNLLKLG
jgi:predicted DNA-binding protein with PD1-like motif